MIIGLTGFARSGKDTASFYLSEITGYQTYALASPLKFIINSLFKWDERHSDGNLKEKEALYTAHSWRENLLTLCRDIFRDLAEGMCDDYLTRLFYIKVLTPYMVGENSKEDKITLRCSPRQIYQSFGTEFARRINPQIWVELAKIKAAEEGGDLIVTDIRFDNEAKWITEEGGSVVKIDRSIAKPVSKHVSEAGVSKEFITCTLQNNGTFKELENGIDYLYDHILTKTHTLNIPVFTGNNE